jgi:nucleoid-associated protein YgaU
MTDPALKTALALCVLLAGFCAAAVFRHNRPPSPNLAAAEQLALRCRSEFTVPAPRGRRSNRSEATEAPPAPATPPTTILTPSDRHEDPPPLAPEFPEAQRPVRSGWSGSMNMMLPIAAPGDATATTHRIVDGDTLAALAAHYLGSADRAMKIFEANRDVLRDPRLLPIGVELKLPGRSTPPR